MDRTRSASVPLALANLGLKFLLEIVAVGSLFYWGLQATEPPLRGVALGLGAAAALIVVWALVLAPTARSGLTRARKNGLGAVVLLIAAGALAAAGQPTAGVINAVLIVVNAALLILLGDDAARALGDVGHQS
jgi:Protein of unknown function (DUF2568)